MFLELRREKVASFEIQNRRSLPLIFRQHILYHVLMLRVQLVRSSSLPIRYVTVPGTMFLTAPQHRTAYYRLAE